MNSNELVFSVELLTYEEVLSKIHGHENHLLLGNGFNISLGVKTSYSNIFQKMMDIDFGLYKEVEPLVKKCGHDLEQFIGILTKDINSENIFLKKFVSNKIKMDFMKVTIGIVKAAIKNVYAEKNSGVYLLLKEFTNYFTLNYDPLLYLLLLNFKSGNKRENTTLVMKNSLQFVEESLNKQAHNIYKEIKHAREHGQLVMSGIVDNSKTASSFKTLKKSRFVTVIEEYSEKNKKGWKKKEINKVVNSMLEEEKKYKLQLKIDDGIRQCSLLGDEKDYEYDIDSTTQNLFFLHGAFHIYKDRKLVKKITQNTDKALYDKIEDILNKNEHELVCIFQNENKKEEIEKNTYLKKCLKKLNILSGTMVIIGSSLDDNDDHIFEEINKSKVETLYISTLVKEKNKTIEKAIKKFPSKSIHLFDAESISYKLPVAQEKDVVTMAVCK